MHSNLSQMLNRTPLFRPADLGLFMERIHTHAIKPRLSAEEFGETIASLGFKTPRDFAEAIGIDPRTAETWGRFGMSRDAAQLLLALVNYRNRLVVAMTDFEHCTQIPLESFFEDHQLP